MPNVSCQSKEIIKLFPCPEYPDSHKYVLFFMNIQIVRKIKECFHLSPALSGYPGEKRQEREGRKYETGDRRRETGDGDTRLDTREEMFFWNTDAIKPFISA